MTTVDPIDVVISFDTTGSMYSCLSEVRRKVEQLVQRLFAQIPGLHIGVITHGDYCAGDDVMTYLDLTNDEKKICSFVRTAPRIAGGDLPECYELVLHQARSFAWRAGKAKVLILIGDDVPHGPEYRQNTKNLDWRNEISLLMEAGVHIYGVQALARRHATHFYKEIAHKTGGLHLELYQFSAVNDLVMAVCYNQESAAAFEKYEAEVESAGRMTDTTGAMFDVLAGREVRKIHATRGFSGYGGGTARRSTTSVIASGDVDESKLIPVHPSRFQVLDIDRASAIRDFVQDRGLIFKTGRGFYEFTKTVTVQPYKEVVLVNNDTGAMFSGAAARGMLGLTTDGSGGNVRLRPGALKGYTAFIQSTSYNRKLLGGTSFLYEVEDWERAMKDAA
jgi:hypothetical protein